MRQWGTTLTVALCCCCGDVVSWNCIISLVGSRTGKCLYSCYRHHGTHSTTQLMIFPTSTPLYQHPHQHQNHHQHPTLLLSLTISILSRSWSRSSVCLFGIQVRDHLRHSCWYEQTEDHAASFNIHLDVLSFGVVDLTVSVLVEHYSHFITL